MLSFDDRNANKKVTGSKKTTIFLIILVGIICIGYYLFKGGTFDLVTAKMKEITLNNGKESASHIELDASKQYQFGTYRDLAIICDRDFVRAIAQNGSEKWKFPLNFSLPVLDTNEKYVLVGDKGANIIRLFDGTGKKAEVTTEEQIIDAKLSGGCITAVTKQKGYKGAVLVYSLNGDLLFRWMSGTANIICANLSPDGNNLAVSVVDTTLGKLTGGIMMFNIKTGSTPFAGLTYPECLLSTVVWSDNGLLVACGDKCLIGIDGQGKEKWKYDYGGRGLASFDIKTSKQYVLAFISGGDETAIGCDVEFLDGNGKKTGNYKMVGEVRNVTSIGGDVLVAGQRELAMVSRNGSEKSKKPLKFDIRYIKPFTSGGKALAVSGVRAEIIDIR